MNSGILIFLRMTIISNLALFLWLVFVCFQSFVYSSLKMGTVIPMAITAIYLSKQGVSDLGYTQANVYFRL